jgi:hypothetical protein
MALDSLGCQLGKVENPCDDILDETMAWMSSQLENASIN